MFRRNKLAFLFAIGMFVFGLTMHKYKYFPYYTSRNITKNIIRHIKNWSVNLEKVLSKQYSNSVEKLSLYKDIDTALLPIRIQGVRISDFFPIPKVAGGITTVGNTVVVLDRLGNLYSHSFNNEVVNRLPFPALPNNIESYLKEPWSNLDTQTFRAYNIEYLKPAKMFAVAHEYFDTQFKKTRMAVSVINIEDQTIRPIGSWKTIFVSDLEPDGSNDASGGKLISKYPDKLYLTIGYYLIKSSKVSQDINSSFGKIIEIDVNTRKTRVISIGHRNPQGLLITKSGELLSTEHGPAGGDKLNLITEGANYGWPNVTLGTDYGTYGWQNNSFVGQHTGYQTPIFAWVPSIGVSNVIQVEGFHRRWDGDLIVSSLKAQSLFRLRMDQMRVLYSEPIWVGQRIRDIRQLENGTIVLWTDDTQLLFISVDHEKLDRNVRPAKLISDTLSQACMFCHHFGSTNASDFAPTLSNLLGRKIASDNFRYSAGLRSKEGVWTEETLREFLLDPGKFANGTAMPTPHINQNELNEIIQALKQDTDR